MAMYCMQCSALGATPLTAACACGHTRWRGTYELPQKPYVVVPDEGSIQALALIDGIRKMIQNGQIVPGSSHLMNKD